MLEILISFVMNLTQNRVCSDCLLVGPADTNWFALFIAKQH